VIQKKAIHDLLHLSDDHNDDNSTVFFVKILVDISDGATLIYERLTKSFQMMMKEGKIDSD
jgi:hypothetical protein